MRIVISNLSDSIRQDELGAFFVRLGERMRSKVREVEPSGDVAESVVKAGATFAIGRDLSGSVARMTDGARDEISGRILIPRVPVKVHMDVIADDRSSEIAALNSKLVDLAHRFADIYQKSVAIVDSPGAAQTARRMIDVTGGGMYE